MPTQISLRPGMPFQPTLFQLAQAAAQTFAAQGAAGDWLTDIGISLFVLSDPVMHGTVAAPALEGFDPREPCCWSWSGASAVRFTTPSSRPMNSSPWRPARPR